ncbi:tyrosine-type recombinase/integrase [Paenibacillus lautus]|uniref:tyrosine-type recombinase/integrase n=1 Tax=Paenibacillus lautus TaxID=1401 RepID=UPI003D2A6BA9
MGHAVNRSNVAKKVSIHVVRYSLTMHLLEGGTDLRYIQKLLGYQRSRTTGCYTYGL